jgi:NAD(P)-dependent dehydrogenase (short-subunit alcohol dehydrogenase family)
MPMRGLSGKTAIVTGAARGLGAATVRRLVEEGCRVTAVDVDDLLEQLTRECGDDRVLALRADVRSEAECDRYVAEAAAAFGAVHLFVNNAGVIGRHYPIAEMPTEEFERVHAVNLRGVFFGLRAALRQMIRQGQGGSIVNVASVGALRANRYSSSYGSAKRAVVGLSGAAALENGQHGIRVNTVCPGPMDTPMLRPALGNMDGDLNAPFRNQAIPRIGRPEEIAAFIAFLLSDEASYMTGGVYPVDGGFMI